MSAHGATGGRRRVLVTGGAGYVGSHACKALRHAGWEPVVFDDLSGGHESLVRYGPFVAGDVTQAAALARAIEWLRPVACLHLAARVAAPESVVDPMAYYRTNVGGTLALVEAMLACGVRHLVHSSSCAVYGQAGRQPIDESAPLSAISPYGRSKAMAEQILEDCDRAHGLRSIRLRYFNAAGADPDGEVGELHAPELHLIPRALLAAARLIPALEVCGTDYPTADGSAVRDYTHVSDLAQAHVAALEHLVAGGAGDTLNLGLGHGRSVWQVVRAAERAVGRRVTVVARPRRPGDPAAIVADASRAERVLGFRPRLTGLDDMVGSAWRFLQSRPDHLERLRAAEQAVAAE